VPTGSIPAMQTSDRIAALDQQGRGLAAAAERAELDADVPACPGWTVRDLLAHTGQVHRWAATHVREGGSAVSGGRRPPLTQAPAEGVLDWFIEGHRALVDTLRRAPSDIDSWTFLPAPVPLAFWARRQAHETAIHRADAESATDEVPAYEVELAADGLDELIGGFMARPGGELHSDPPCSLLVAPTDVAVRWHITVLPDGRKVSHDGATPADCTVRGSASDLYLFLWNRRPARPPAVTGDSRVLELWQGHARIRWR
jgi:uncharacterized protein (TIGR03083 family)